MTHIYVPRDLMPDYYAATDVKHFGDPTVAGSKFLDLRLRKVEDVLLLAEAQRGSLDGDDRELFVASGSSEEAFQDDVRYLMVHTPGTVGVRSSDDVSDDVVVDVVRMKPGAACTVIFTVDAQPVTDYGCVIIGGEPEHVYTVFPGPVTVSQRVPELESLEGTRITVAEAKRILGSGFWLNTRVL